MPKPKVSAVIVAMIRKFDVTHYEQLLEVIENEFGLIWLERRVRVAPNLKFAQAHIIPPLWSEAKELIRVARRGKNFQISEGVRKLFEIAEFLKCARELPNYRGEVTPGKLKSSNFLDCVYPAEVATMAVKAGFEVAFIPPAKSAGEKTADLLMKFGEYQIESECKRKNTYTPIEFNQNKWKELERNLLDLQDNLAFDNDITVCAISSLSEAAIAELPNAARQILETGKDGDFLHRALSSAVIVQRVKPPLLPKEMESALYIPSNRDTGNIISVAQSSMVLNEGKMVRGPMRRVSFCLINAHSFEQILQDFNRARKQITPGAFGIIYIKLDVSKVIGNARGIYMRILSYCILSKFSPTCNTRVAAVVLTTDSELLGESEEFGPSGILNGLVQVSVIKNPYFPFPDGLRIPGQSK